MRYADWYLFEAAPLFSIFGPMPRTPSLDALRIFVVAARHQSFTDAASTLNLTQSAISHRIRGLEEELGFALFKRLTRGLELTPQGHALAHRIDHAMSGQISQIGADTRIDLDAKAPGAGAIVLKNTQPAAISASDFLFSWAWCQGSSASEGGSCMRRPGP